MKTTKIKTKKNPTAITMMDDKNSAQAKLIADACGTLMLFTQLDTGFTITRHTPIDIKMVSVVAETAGFEIEDIDNQTLR